MTYLYGESYRNLAAMHRPQIDLEPYKRTPDAASPERCVESERFVVCIACIGMQAKYAASYVDTSTLTLNTARFAGALRRSVTLNLELDASQVEHRSSVRA